MYMSKSHRLQVLITPELSARLAKAAQRARLSQGEFVRRSLEHALTEVRAVRDPVKALAGLKAPTGDIEQVLAEIDAGRQ